MFEEKTFNVPELATRWNKTPRQILEHAASMKLGLLFDFDGLVIDARGDRLVQYDAGQKREHENLTAFVYGAEDKFKRRIAGLLRQGETLTTPEAIDLRKEVMTAQAKIKTLEDVFDVVTRERIKYHYRGYLRATPETVNDLLRQGFAVHPNIAHRLDGTIVRLDVGKAQWQERLEPTDMLVMLDEVKAIEAAVGKAAPAKAKARNGRPKMIDKKANAVRQIVELFEKTAAIQF